jgi:group I intron endonuclease
MINTKELPCLPGVYCIKNETNGKVYVGSSNKIQKRVRSHKNRLELGTHCCSHLQNAWNSYGPAAFSASILELTDCTEESILAAEQKFLDLLRPFDSDKGYNSSPIAERCVHTPESKEKLRCANLGKRYGSEARLKRARFGPDNHFFGHRHTESTIAKIQETRGIGPFVCVETGEVFTSYSEAANKLGARSATISDCIKGTRRMSGGYHFVSVDYLSKPPITGLVNLPETEKADLIRRLDPKRRLFRCLNTGELFSCVAQAASTYGLHRCGISDCLSGQSKQTRGFAFSYI